MEDNNSCRRKSDRGKQIKYSCHKSPKDKAILQLIRNFILSTCTFGLPPPYSKSFRKSKVVPARNTETKLKFHYYFETLQRSRNSATMLIHSSDQSLSKLLEIIYQ